MLFIITSRLLAIVSMYNMCNISLSQLGPSTGQSNYDMLSPHRVVSATAEECFSL